MMPRFCGFVLVALLVSDAAAQGGRGRPMLEGKPELVRKIIEGMRTLRYSGTRSMEFKQGVERESHVEIILKDGPRTRIEFPRDSKQVGQIVIETIKDRFHYFPDTNEVHVMPPRREEALGRLGEILRLGMRIETTDGERVAGMATKLLTVSNPRGTVVQKLWVNPRNGFVAKRELFDPLGARVGLMEFRDVNFSVSIDPKDFRILNKNARFVYPKDVLRKMARASGLEPLMLPESDDVRLDSTRLSRVEGEPVLVQTYQSPEGPISFFQTRAKVRAERFSQMASQQGLRSYVWQSGNVTLALIGRKSESELERLAKSASDR